MNELSSMIGQGSSASESAKSPAVSPGFAQQLSMAQNQYSMPGNSESYGNLPQLGYPGAASGAYGQQYSPYGMQGSYPGATPGLPTAQYPGQPYSPYGAMPGVGSPYGYPGAYGVGGPYAPYGYGQNAGQQIVDMARREIGVAESPPGSNDGERISMYRSATAGANSPGPWCAYFVSWLCKEAGAPIGAGGAGTGYVPTLESWGKNTGRYFSGRLPQPGDIAIFNFGGGISDHTGIVESVDPDGTIHTIEGNSSDRVSQRKYSLGQIKGFVHPG